MRSIYTGLFYLLLPFVFMRLFWRGFKAPAYWRRWNERLGFYKTAVRPGAIWFHAVSVGEAESLFQLLKLIQHENPEQQILITTTTPTGSARVLTVMDGSVYHVYLPYDIPGAINRFIKHFQPKLAVIMETEIWPNLFFACGKQAIPLLIINARLSKKSEQGYKKLSSFMIKVLSNVKLIAAQTNADSERFINIGAKKKQVRTVGNIKFDLNISEKLISNGKHLKTQQFNKRQVWIIASTHDNEEHLFLQIYKKIKVNFPQLLLIIVPRHPERFKKVRLLCEDNQLNVVLRSSKKNCTLDTDVYLADTMGELKMLYSASDVAFVGGSMVPIGGHNVLEPAVIGIPVMFGPYMDNFKDIERGILNASAAVKCVDINDIETTITKLLVDEKYRIFLTKQAKTFVLENRGAIDRAYTLIEGFIKTV